MAANERIAEHQQLIWTCHREEKEGVRNETGSNWLPGLVHWKQWSSSGVLKRGAGKNLAELSLWEKWCVFRWCSVSCADAAQLIPTSQHGWSLLSATSRPEISRIHVCHSLISRLFCKNGASDIFLLRCFPSYFQFSAKLAIGGNYHLGKPGGTQEVCRICMLTLDFSNNAHLLPLCSQVSETWTKL